MAKVNATPLELPHLKNAFSTENFKQLKNTVLALMFTQMLTRFETETDSDGNKWKPLKDEQFKRRNKKIKSPAKKGNIKVLQDDGTLRQSWTQRGAEGNEVSMGGKDVVLGSNIEYVRTHNEGLTIQHPGTENGFGKGIKIPPYKIQMPERRMTGFSTQDQEEIDELVLSFLDSQGFENG